MVGCDFHMRYKDKFTNTSADLRAKNIECSLHALDYGTASANKHGSGLTILCQYHDCFLQQLCSLCLVEIFILCP